MAHVLNVQKVCAGNQVLPILLNQRDNFDKMSPKCGQAEQIVAAEHLLSNAKNIIFFKALGH